jgi:hypothetical protein
MRNLFFFGELDVSTSFNLIGAELQPMLKSVEEVTKMNKAFRQVFLIMFIVLTHLALSNSSPYSE